MKRVFLARSASSDFNMDFIDNDNLFVRIDD